MTILSNKTTSVDYRTGAPGVNPFDILDISADLPYGMGGFEENLGGITRVWERDPDTLVMRPLQARRGNPEPITFSVSVTMRAVNKIERLRARDRFDIRWRGIGSGRAGDLLNYDHIKVFLDAMLETRGVDTDMALRDSDQGEEENLVLSANVNAGAYYIQVPLNATILTTGLAAMVDVDFRDAILYDDGTDIYIYAVTDVDVTGTTSYLLVATVDRITGDVGPWTSYVLTGYTTGKDVDFVVRSGDKVIVGSNGGAMVSYADVADLSTWTTDAVTFAADAPNAAFVPYAGFIVVVCDGGAVFESVDGGLSYTETLVGGTLTAQNLACVNFVNGNTGYAGGAAGALLKYVAGDWSLLTDPTSGAAIQAIAIPEGRPDDVYIGCDDATIWHSHNAAVPNVAGSWEQYRYPGDTAGSCDDIGFTMEWYGPSLFIVHTAAGGESRILRDLSGGAGGNTMVEAITGADITTNSGLVKILPIDSNYAVAVGNVHSTAEMVMKVMW